MPRTRFWIAAALALVAIGVAIGLDPWARAALVRPRIYDGDLGRLQRVMGFVPTWLVAALALWLHDRAAARGGRRAAWLALAPIAGGAAAEVLKLVFRRERPGAIGADYVYRAFDDRTWSTSGLGLPSSHTMVAFSAAAVLARLFPEARWVWYALATGCALSRVLAEAHWLSDVTVGAVAAIALVAFAWSKRTPPASPTA
jgi:membrane-associated phospholipid phosphatase